MIQAKSLMFQGTCSDAGKSVLTAALCRILFEDGLRVAPFKAQNMSLNSFVTRDGLEMGRAQVVQSQACLLDPDVRMNPVLLKPSSDVGSQVIVMGRPVGNMSVKEYVVYKPTAWKAIQDAYNSLVAEFDVIILEGAGSPAEINLKHHDIVNMKMARYANAPVLLAGDIERGGVFASLVGTMELLDDEERDLLAGFVINRFRGDASLLTNGIEMIAERTGKPFVGTIPYIKNLGLPEEDSVSFKNGLFEQHPPEGEYVTIALIDLPHISNFTDVEPFLDEPDVHLEVVKKADDLKEPAAIILPGSKNVIADNKYLEESGLGTKIIALAVDGKTEIVGICGGFQLLGHTIEDPHGLESGGHGSRGLGLLPVSTVLDSDKTLIQRTFKHVASNCKVTGYEIHHGRSTGDCPPLLQSENGEKAGANTADGLIWGSYLHGIFDSDLFRRWFIDRLRQRTGHNPVGKILAPYDLEPAFSRLASVVRHHLDMERIYRILRV